MEDLVQIITGALILIFFLVKAVVALIGYRKRKVLDTYNAVIYNDVDKKR